MRGQTDDSGLGYPGGISKLNLNLTFAEFCYHYRFRSVSGRMKMHAFVAAIDQYAQNDHAEQKPGKIGDMSDRGEPFRLAFCGMMHGGILDKARFIGGFWMLNLLKVRLASGYAETSRTQRPTGRLTRREW